MTSSVQNEIADIRVRSVTIDHERLVVELQDGRAIAAPIAWYPRLRNATPEQRENWQIAGGDTESIGPTWTKT